MNPEERQKELQRLVWRAQLITLPPGSSVDDFDMKIGRHAPGNPLSVAAQEFWKVEERHWSSKDRLQAVSVTVTCLAYDDNLECTESPPDLPRLERVFVETIHRLLAEWTEPLSWAVHTQTKHQPDGRYIRWEINGYYPVECGDAKNKDPVRDAKLELRVVRGTAAVLLLTVCRPDLIFEEAGDERFKGVIEGTSPFDPDPDQPGQDHEPGPGDR